MNSKANVATVNAKRYLGQFCKHFAHRIAVELADDFSSGQVNFGGGVCLLAAAPEMLTLVLDAPEADIPRLQDVVARHLVRFAFREELTLDWS